MDAVAVNDGDSVESSLRLLRPDIFVRGPAGEPPREVTGATAREDAVLAELGIRAAYTADMAFDSASRINEFISTYPQDVREYLELFRGRHRLDELLAVIAGMARLRVLVVGDAIVDEYAYCEAIGKSSKDPVLAMRYLSEDRFAGGALAVANHLANFAGRVELVSVLGTRNSQEAFVRAGLRPEVVPHFFQLEGCPTVTKRRILDGYTLTKLIEIYDMDTREMPASLEDALCDRLRSVCREVDLVLASDFGHGAVSPRMVATLCESAPFLAVNTQANAGNRGFHTLARYPRADYACIAEHEMRLDARDPRSDLRPIVDRACRRLGARYVTVTTGSKGCVVGTENGTYVAVPAFARKVVDRVGAGDAFLAVTSLAAAQRAPAEQLGFIGNVVGAAAVEIVGNKKSITREQVVEFIRDLWK